MTQNPETLLRRLQARWDVTKERYSHDPAAPPAVVDDVEVVMPSSGSITLVPTSARYPTVELEFEVDSPRRQRCTRLVVEHTDVTPAMLSDLMLPTMVQAAVSHGLRTTSFEILPDRAAAFAYSERRRTRSRMTDAKLREIAQLYRAALAEGVWPAKAIAARFNVTDGTARKYVMRARERGYLTKDTERGRTKA